ncbi:iron chelate uptake ABC transporter family permease subunit [Clostridium sardiniense]|uniref:Iron chelate uptake ABC transporter family permease subunit n=1 Tax=Clostridium sardiniense TaxID=29369 RepID=A0ABS7KU54_CLOSR|nr:iron chelate uptake ABC transporter family permease subunit [Clostridium sardiniense]MBY0754348.1 iron chelate uptake ABC transporter family permease subunit [Clostridium sardiniense]
MKSNKKKLIILALASIVFVALYLFWGLNGQNFDYNLSKRIPKVIGIIVAGGSIAVSSILFQTITNNRIITPSIIGLDALYGLVQTIAVFIFGSSSIMMTNNTLNFLVSGVLMVGFSFVLFNLLFKKGKQNIMILLLVGTVLGGLFRSMSTFMQVLIDPNEYEALQSRLFASFSSINTKILFMAIVIILIIFAFLYDEIKKLDVMSLGRDQAINLGIDYDKLTKKILIIVTALVALSTALVGPITFLGILVVNLTYQMFNTFKHSLLLIGSILISIVALVSGQFLVERVFTFNTTIGIIINFIGGIYFIYLLLKESRV